MEIERSLTSIQWKIARAFLIATVSSGLLMMVLLLLLWALSTTSYFESTWLGKLFAIFQDGKQLYSVILLLLATAGTAALVGGGVYGYYTGRKIKRSLQAISWAAEKLTAGELNYRIVINGDDEVAELADQFNRMADRLEEQVSSLQHLVNENAELHRQASQLAVNEERQRLARELHDSISQQLFAIMMSMAACSRIIDKDIDKAKKQFLMIEQLAAQAQAEMRALLLHLRPVQLEGKSLTVALDELLTELKQKHPVEYTWKIDEIENLPSGIEEHIFRIAQEGLSNALRHSHASKVELSLRKHQNNLVLRISDNGTGFILQDQRQGSSMGLKNIEDRTNEIGGVLEILSSVGKGTTIIVRVPILTMGDGEDE